MTADWAGELGKKHGAREHVAGGPSLVAALEGTVICVNTRDAQGVSRDAEHTLRPDRSDDETAAYVLQQWMERL